MFSVVLVPKTIDRLQKNMGKGWCSDDVKARVQTLMIDNKLSFVIKFSEHHQGLELGHFVENRYDWF